MYKLVNYDRNWSYPKLFTTFKDCYMMHQIHYDVANNIEYIDFNNYERTIVWNRQLEEM